MDASKTFSQFASCAHFLVTGEDSGDFLQSQFTNDLRPFEEGKCTYGLWLDVKGKVLGDSWILCEGEEQFRVLSERSDGERIRTHLKKHIIADDVEIESLEPATVFELPSTALDFLGLSAPERGRFLQTEAGTLYSARNGIYNMLILDGAQAKCFWDGLDRAGFIELSSDLRGLARINACIPLVPDEIGDTDLPGEGELEQDAISFTKGCYLGQEVVARMHNIGKPQRRLFVLEGLGNTPDLPLAIYNRNSKQVGELRTAYSDENIWRGVALLKTRFAGDGERLQNEDIQMSVIKPLRESTFDE
jgi:hypothetical protein